MKITNIKSLVIPEIKIITFHRFTDQRGYFTETYRESDFIKAIPNFTIKQINESQSQKGILRGLHAQWNPYMGKLIRTLYGHMIDLIIDIRLNSPTFGKIIAYDMPTGRINTQDQWIWVPVGFAHGNYYLEDSAIEYLCTGEYSPKCEISINPLSDDIDWSLCENKILGQFNQLKTKGFIQSKKDQKGISLSLWQQNKDSFQFKY